MIGAGGGPDMALSDRTPTTFKTNLFIPAVYAATVVKAAKKNLVCFDAIDSSWRSNLKKGDTLYIGKTNVVTATEVVVGSNGSALNPFNTTGITLVINQWYEAPVYIDDMSLHQTQVDAEAQAAEEAAYAVDLRIDTSVATLFSALNGGSLPGQSDGQTFTSDLAEDLVETLQEADVPWDGNISLITDPSGLSDMLKIDKLLSADFAGLKGILVNGVIGASSLVWGAKVRVTNNLVAAT